MEDLKSLVRKLQGGLQPLPNLLARAETMSLAEAEDLSNKLFASARDLTAVAGAVVANSARKVHCSCIQGAVPAKGSLPGSLPTTQSFHESGIHGLTSRISGFQVYPGDEQLIFESSETVSAVLTFDDLGLKGDLLHEIYAYSIIPALHFYSMPLNIQCILDFEKPLAIQQLAILPITQDRDVIAQAQSGSGKTATFLISILQSIDVTVRETQVLALSPRRQLATQIQSMVLALGHYMNIQRHACVGGTSIGEDFRKLKCGQHVVSGAPGPVLEMINKGHLKTPNIKMLVLDEADDLLNKGFKDQIYHLYRYLPPVTQVVLLSATFPNNVSEMSNFLASKFVTEPICILVKRDQLIPDGIKQFFVTIEKEDSKFDTLCDLLDTLIIKQAIIFCNTRRKVDRLSHKMRVLNFTVSSIHDEMVEKERDANMAEFRNGTSRVLVATDARARRVDFLVSTVINYDIPASHENYLHRIGRSGRFGCEGLVISLATADDVRILRDIEQYYSTQINEMPVNAAELI